MVAASVYSVSAFIFRLGGCLRSGVRSSFRRGDFAEEGKWERGCVASGSCSVGGPYKALGVPHALAFASEAVCASAGFAHNDAFFDVRGARCLAARCQCARACVGRYRRERGMPRSRRAHLALGLPGTQFAKRVWLRLLGLLLSLSATLWWRAQVPGVHGGASSGSVWPSLCGAKINKSQ